ncbi:MAG: prepilin-type N-terminal cleavage/methylation domain-containing protein [Kiritimatiellae bacterium]|nr:prepilin-type N-terminal cleavage/methylation domain-containing protein [Kiritimatiellia bacterium]
MKASAISKDCGFTLIEVLVSLVVLSTGIVLVLRAMGTSAGALSAARVTSRSVWLADQRLAEIDIARAAGETVATERGDFLDPFTSYRWAIDVEESSEAAGASSEEGGVGHLHLEISRHGSDRVDLELDTLVLQ